MSNREIPEVPFTAHGTGATWTQAAQRHAVRAGRLERLQPGVVAGVLPADQPRYVRARIENLRRAQAAALACDRSALSHASGAIAWGLPVLGRAVKQSCVTVQSGTALRTLAKVHLHRAGLGDTATIDGFATTWAARTVIDFAREHGIVAGLAAADEALHTGLTSHDELAAELEVQRRWPGVRAARFVTEFAEALTESPLESVSRLRIHQHGLPAPRPQRLICDEHGVIVTRSDFYWDEFGVVGESDGAMKWEKDPAARDKRDEKTYRLEGLGLIVIRWGWPDLWPFDAVARRLRYAFERGARPGSPLRRWHVLEDADFAPGIVTGSR